MVANWLPNGYHLDNFLQYNYGKIFKLGIKDAAHKEIIVRTFMPSPTNPLPVLTYDANKREWGKSSYSIASRIVFCVENPTLVLMLEGKFLDYPGKKFW